VLADQPLVDAAEAASIGGVDGGAERHRLTVHRAACAHDEVRLSDQALRIDRARWHDQRREAQRAHVRPLLLGARNDHGVDVVA
jgi:hypothetical protein